VPVVAFLERGGQDRQRGREHHRRAEALRKARADQNSRAAGESTGQRGQAEQHRAGDEDAAAAEQVGGAAAQQHEPAVGQQVGAGHPLQALHREVQGLADRGQRQVDDRRVDEVEKRDSTEQRERELASARRKHGRFRSYCCHEKALHVHADVLWVSESRPSR
jgi:hypothetical protein